MKIFSSIIADILNTTIIKLSISICQLSMKRDGDTRGLPPFSSTAKALKGHDDLWVSKIN